MNFLSLNQFLRQHFGHRVQKIPLDAGLSCPNRKPGSGKGGCIYCNPQGSGSGAHARGVGIGDQLEQGMKWASRRYKAKAFIAYFQSYSNTFAPLERLEEIYRQAANRPEIVGVAIGTRPDCVDRHVLELIRKIFKGKMVWMEYGLQSASDLTLKMVNRGHTVQDFIDAVRLTREFPFLICAHVIFGLPGETRKQMLDTVGLVRELGLEGIKFHQLYVVKNTLLHRFFEDGEYRPISLDDYASTVAHAIRLLPADTVIQRLTGDPAPGELVAPSWAGRKDLILKRIGAYL